MYLTNEDMVMIDIILKIVEIIYSQYFDSNSTNLEDLADNIRIIEDIIASLKIDLPKLNAISDYLKDSDLDLPDSKLLVGTSPILNRKNYPHTRLLYNLIYKFKKPGSFLGDQAYPDQEVSVFYNFMHSLRQENPILQSYMQKILIDSPKVEREIINNGLQPLETVTIIRSSKRFYYLAYDVIYRILNEMKLGIKTPDVHLSEYLMKINYLKTILLYLRPEVREEAIHDFLDSIDKTKEYHSEIMTLKKSLDTILGEVKEFEDNHGKVIDLVPKKNTGALL